MAAVIRDNLDARQFVLDSPFLNVKIVGVRIGIRDASLRGRNVVVIVVYVPPSLVDDYVALFDYLDQAVDYSRSIFVVGDFNIPELADYMTGTGPTCLFIVYSQYTSLNYLFQHNSVLNCNPRLLELVLSTSDVVIDVCEFQQSIVTEDPYHPCLAFQYSAVGVSVVLRFCMLMKSQDMAFTGRILENCTYLCLTAFGRRKCV